MEPNERTCTVLFQLYSNAGRVDKAYETLSMMVKKGIVPNIRHLNVLLSACVMHEDINKIIAVTDLMKGLLVKPDLNTYTSFIFLNARLNRHDMAFQVLDDLVANGFKPDLVIYKALLDICVATNNATQMISLFDRMRADGINPDTGSYRLAIKVARKHWPYLHPNIRDDWRRLAAWAPWDNHTCLHVLRLVTSKQDTERVCSWFHLLADKYHLPTPEAAYATLLWLCVDAKDKEGAVVAVRRMAYKGMPLHVILSAFICAACETGRPEAAEEVMELIEMQAGVQPAPPDLEALLKGAVGAGHLPTATRTLAALEARGANPAELDRWRVALRSVEDEARLREELAAQPRTQIPVRKYALFKSSLAAQQPSPPPRSS